jgi:hypothetical protein
MRYDEMDSANQACCDRIAATLVAGAMFVGAIGMTIGVLAVGAPPPATTKKCKLVEIQPCLSLFPIHSMVEIQGTTYCMSFADKTKRVITFGAVFKDEAGNKTCAAG